MAVEEKNNKYNFDEYIRHGEPSQREKAEAWKTAIGLQAVDGLKPSQYLVETAQKHIVGELTIDEVRKEIDNYYIRKESRTNEERGEEETSETGEFAEEFFRDGDEDGEVGARGDDDVDEPDGAKVFV